MMNRIKTNIKFYRGLKGKPDTLYGFVMKAKGCWMGCGVETPKKRIVFVDAEISAPIIPGVLYRCSLIPMRGGDGFIAKSATVVTFKASIQTECRGKAYAIKVVFGNRAIVYDPGSKDRRKRDIQGIADILRSRVDLKDAVQVAEDFITSASAVKRLYEQAANV